MSKKVTIPTCMDPFIVMVNGLKYSYPAGQEVEVPDDIAQVIERHNATHKKNPDGTVAPHGGNVGVSSWNDLTDKPFYSETVEVLPETTVEIDPEMGMGMLPDLAIIADDECTIKYNGTDYVCKCVDNGYVLVLGNFGMMDEENPVDTGEPFVIAKADVGDGNLIWAIMPLDGSASVTLSVIGQAHHPVPDKYMLYKIVDLNMTGIYDTFGNISLTPDMTFGEIYNACSAPRTLVTCYLHTVVDGAKITTVYILDSIAPDIVGFIRNSRMGNAVRTETINCHSDGTCLYTVTM